MTIGFFSGVIFDPNHASSKASAAVGGKGTANLGIMFGALSSLASAGHAVLIKRGLAIVNGSPMALSYYNNILSTAFLIPMVVVAGELPGTMRILSGYDAKTFVAGASITVSYFNVLRCRTKLTLVGILWLPHQFGIYALYQSHLTSHP